VWAASILRKIAIIQARMGSTRLPGKVLEDLNGRPVLSWVVDAANAIPGIERAVIATSDVSADDPIVEWCYNNEIICLRGPETDVLARFVHAAKAEKADTVMRLTADCPLLDPQVCGQVLMLMEKTGADYASNIDPASWPDGLDCEVFTTAALLKAEKLASRLYEREHVTPFIRNNRRIFLSHNLRCPLPNLAKERWTLDTPNDLVFLKAVVEILNEPGPFSFINILHALDNNPSLRKINSDFSRNEGAAKSKIKEDAPDQRLYTTSNKMLRRAEEVIPLGSQTFSKSHISFPAKKSPLFLTHGNNGRVWDVDGNEYVDLICGLLPVVLGYRDPDIDAAIRNQLDQGISFSLSTELETNLAERLVEIIPCAEMVRFGKNGSDATSAAIRLARAFTGRDHVAVCGYHGWQDWYIGSTTRNKGVPKSFSDLTHPVTYNDLDAVDGLLKKYRGEVAALILEPMTVTEPSVNYLSELKELLNSHGSLLIFDENITGFRYAIGGAQELFDVTPDLASFGKAMGNGMPISSIVGRADVMNEMENVFYSGTFGGETLSLAAAIAVIDKMRREPVIEQLWKTGKQLSDSVMERIEEHGLSEVMTLNGKAPWRVMAFSDHPEGTKESIKTIFMREMLSRGVLMASSHNICYAHNHADMTHVATAYDGALARIAEELATGELEERLGIPPIKPIFSIR
jgi:glutamate-1-semialdehyde aminotransferase/spore coat polysaccharide biosynthesis protein SpsF (cytidylyltransferase family)